MDPFEPIIFLENNQRIRSLFDSFWGMESVVNPLVNFNSEEAFWKSLPGKGTLLIVDAHVLTGDVGEWIKKFEKMKPHYRNRIILVVETKEEREKMLAQGVSQVLRLPFQWSQWLPVMKKMGFRWGLWSR